MIEKIETFFGKQIFRIIHVDLHDHRNSIFLAGSARSGTTWLQEIINYKNDYRVLFEPFRPEKVGLVSDWEQYQYLPLAETSSKFISPMKDILSGKIKNVWVDTYNHRLFSKKRIIKAIHANLFLYWMKNHFPEVPIILILRHPCAVANSKLNIVEKYFRFTQNPLDEFLNQQKLMDDFLLPYADDIKSPKTNFETFIFMWCIEYLIPITQFSEGDIHITFYENLCENSEQEIKKIFSFLDKPYSVDVIRKTRVPSPVSRKTSAIHSGSDLISSWRKSITDNQIQRAIEILNLFGMDKIYNDNDRPLMDANEVLRAF